MRALVAAAAACACLEFPGEECRDYRRRRKRKFLLIIPSIHTSVLVEGTGAWCTYVHTHTHTALSISEYG